MNPDKTLLEMTLEEKCALLSGYTTFSTRPLPRLGIPSILCSDGPHGLRRQAGSADHLGLAKSEPATCFPTASAMANSWNEALGEEIGAALGEEAAGQGVSVLLGPGLNIKRDPLCGRNFEYFSEDPYLSGKMAAAYVRGIQSKGVAACLKHFAVNSQETRRMASDSVVDERTLMEIYLTGFEIAVKESRPLAVMTSYNKVNGCYTNENPRLLRDVLRRDWGFDGAVITDWGGSNSHVQGVMNGSILEMPAPGLGSARELIRAVRSGRLTEASVDARVLELLTLIERTGNAAKTKRGYDEAAHHALARRAAGECVVLLKNDGPILPLAKGSRVALVGDFAAVPRYQGSGSSLVNATRVDTLRDLISESGLECVGFAQGFERNGKENASLREEAVELAKRADTVLLCMGLSEANESEGAERRSMLVESNQIDLLHAIHGVNQRVVVLFFSGSAVETPWLDDAQALVYAGLGGQAGAGAVLDVLTGRINPSGKLSETWPMRHEDAPAGNFPSTGSAAEYREALFVGYRYYGTANVAVRFPFGYGMSYTRFSYSNLRLDGRTVRFTVTNTGERDGAEVAQIYISKSDSRIFRAERELKAFAKVELKAGESRDVYITLDDTAFRYWDVKTGAWRTEPGVYGVSVGASSEDIRLRGTLNIACPGAPLPYDMEKLAQYRKADVRNVPDEVFQELLGRNIPDGRAKIDSNMILGDLNHGRSPIFWLVWLILTSVKRGKEKRGGADLDILFLYNMPLRAVARMSGGLADMNVVNGIVLELKGFWIVGLVWALISFVRNLIQNAVMEARLKG